MGINRLSGLDTCLRRLGMQKHQRMGVDTGLWWVCWLFLAGV